MMRTRLILTVLCFVMVLPAANGNEHIKGGCLVGESALAHGRTDAQAVADMRQYAQLYVKNFRKFREAERDLRSAIRELIELDQWTQADIVEFTRQQRELLYLSVGRQLATGRTTAGELPGYARTIRQKITDIEVGLDCDLLPAPQA